MNTTHLIKNSEYLALTSFLGGTAILLYYIISDNATALFVGLNYVYIIAFINLVVLVLILLRAKKTNPNRARLLDAAKVMLLNIPVLILYIGIVIVLLGYVRITFHNNTPHLLEEVQISGCQEKTISNLAPGQKKTVWIAIPADCSIELAYIQKGELVEETVMSYVTSMDGQRMKYNIGDKITD